MTDFKYFKCSENFESYPLALQIILRKNLVIDTKFLPVLEAAENGNYMARLELQESFAYGENGISKNYKMARYYTDILLNETTTCPFLSQTPQLYFEILRASAFLEFNYNDPEIAKLEFVKLIKFMVTHIPFENWDLKIFEVLNFIKSDTINKTLN